MTGLSLVSLYYSRIFIGIDSRDQADSSVRPAVRRAATGVRRRDEASAGESSQH